jgi:pimeloyl-ACP methyl ester carboxylesterase
MFPSTQSNGMVLHKTTEVGGLKISYREAGAPGAPKLVLLHGFPASSHQYRNLMSSLASRFHLVSPDYPGFGNSDMPDPKMYEYSFDKTSAVVEAFRLNVTKAVALHFHGKHRIRPVDRELAISNF